MVEVLAESDVNAAAGVLARAFRDNPGMKAILQQDSPDERLRLMLPCMVGFVQAARRYGTAEVVKESGAVAAVSLSFPPDGFPMPIGGQLVTAKGPLRAGLRRALRFARFDYATRRRHLRDPHFYLWVLGVEPERQGRGFGSALLRSLSARADAANVPSYLETDKESSVRLYERHGYRVTSEEVLAGLDFKLWYMTR
jgi:ribosomal protein S18 acetylase RimI-like enzyme